MDRVNLKKVEEITKEQILKQYRRGVIDESEYKELISNLTNENSLDEKLKSKLNKEYVEFTKRILEKPKEEIFDKAYEITVKKEIKDMISDLALDDVEIAALLKEDDLLKEFYADWLDTDVQLGDAMENSVIETMMFITRYQNKKEKELNGNKNKEMER